MDSSMSASSCFFRTGVWFGVSASGESGPTSQGVPSAWFASVENAYGRQGREAAARWWRGARAPALSSCSDVGFAAFLAASGAPPLPRGGLVELRDDLARAFASTFGEFFVAHASEITALPPRRST